MGLFQKYLLNESKSLSYSADNFEVVEKPKADEKKFKDLKSKLVYKIESKDGQIEVNWFWERSKSKSYRGDRANFEMRGMVGDTGIIEVHYPLWSVEDDIPSAKQMIDSLIKQLKRGHYEE